MPSKLQPYGTPTLLMDSQPYPNLLESAAYWSPYREGIHAVLPTWCISRAGAAGSEWKSGSTLKLHWYERLTTLSACSRLPPREG